MSSRLQATPGRKPLRVLMLLGTRPEAIKLAPVVLAMRRRPAQFSVEVCLTGQHRDLAAGILSAFGIAPHHDLDIMAPGQSLAGATAKILARAQPLLADCQPDMVVVQGDTTTAFSGALAAFYAGVPVAHIEAGLRTGDIESPFPEEMNRLLISRLATFHFAPTTAAAQNLYAEGIPEQRVWVTGNTGIDAVRLLSERLESGSVRPHIACSLDPARKLILVTAHRRENIASGLAGIAAAIRELAQKRADIEILLPLHPNPAVRTIFEHVLARCPRVHLTAPLDYPSFVEVMRRAYLILSDSGGIQEEAPALGKPVLVLRDTTERPEAVAHGATRVVGTDPAQIVAVTTMLLDNPAVYTSMAQVRDVYGDGKASSRICAILSRQERKSTTPQELEPLEVRS